MRTKASGIFITHLECTGLDSSFFYFPLCLTFFYHIGIMLMIVVVFAVIIVLSKSGQETPAPAPRFPFHLLLPLLGAYLILGEIFSFGMANKEMRSLLLVLPVLWLAIFWALERWRVRPGMILIGAMIYAACTPLWVLFNTFDSVESIAQGYPTTRRFETQAAASARTHRIRRRFNSGAIFSPPSKKDLPDSSKIAVGTEQMYVTSESLAWIAQKDVTLDGSQSPYEFHNFLTQDGKGDPGALLGSRGIFLCSQPDFQYSPDVSKASGKLAQYIQEKWEGSYAKAMSLEIDPKGLVGFLIVTQDPLDDARLTELLQWSRHSRNSRRERIHALQRSASFLGGVPRDFAAMEGKEVRR